ncbi:MAG: acetolactate decarboxylase [Desulfovibrionaceae bacterium]
MTYIHRLLGAFLCTAVMLAPRLGWAEQNFLYQISTQQALEAGDFDGDASLAELKQIGDLGFGVFNELDGVLVAVEGGFYRVSGDGKVNPVTDAQKAPFAAVTRFKTDRLLKLEQVDGLEQLETRLDSLLPTPNIFYAVLVQGKFATVKTTSLRRQSKPYPPYEDIIAQQPVFKLANVEGSLIGFRYPCLAQGLGGPGYVWNFLAKDRRSGGRVLECSFEGLTAKIENIHVLNLKLPSDASFYGVGLPEKNSAE